MACSMAALMMAALGCALGAVASQSDYMASMRKELAGLPAPRQLVPPDSPQNLWVYDKSGNSMATEVVDVAGMPFRQARRVRTTRVQAQALDIMLLAAKVAPVEKDGVLLAVFWVRAVRPKGDGTMPMLWAVWREAGGNKGGSWRTLASVCRPLTTEWERVWLPVRSDTSYPEDGIGFDFLLGSELQEVEVGGLALLDFGKDADLAALPVTESTYAGREPDAPWRAAAAERIERLRKGDLRVVVTDADGTPVPGARVAVRMQKHAFWFGTAVAAHRILEGSADGDAYRSWTKKLFNKITLENAMKWGPWEGHAAWLPNAREDAIRAWKWARENGLAVRGHTLVWGDASMNPPDLPGLSAEALRKRINDHILEQMSVFRGGIVEWDVLSEPFTAPAFTDKLGADEPANWFKMAKGIDPTGKMFVNEWGVLANLSDQRTERFIEYVKRLQADGAPVEGVSPQSHFYGGPLLSPEQIMHKLDMLGRLGLEVEPDQTEIILSDEKCHADYMRDFYTMCFSNPAVVGVVRWGYWAGDMWIPPAALLRKDWALRPSGQAYVDLVLGKWWTNEDAVTGDDGACTVRGFLGDYKVEAAQGGRHVEATVSLPMEGAEVGLRVGPAQ